MTRPRVHVNVVGSLDLEPLCETVGGVARLIKNSFQI